MPAITYRARNFAGEEIEGRIQAASENEARATLIAEGMEVLEFGVDSGDGLLSRLSRIRFRRISLSALADVTSQLALMLKTGTSLIDAFEALAEQTSDDKLYEVLTSIKKDVNSGRTLASALSAHPHVFDDFYVSAVRAGEASGTMPLVFARLEADMRQRIEIRSSVATALIYPAVVSVLSMCAVIFVMTFVLPRFVTIFEQSGVDLPLPTQMMMSLSVAMVNYWYLFIGAVVVVPMATSYYISRPRGAALFDRFLLWLPIAGPLTVMLQTSAMLRTIGTLLASGVPLTETLDVAKDACKNSQFRALVKDVNRSVTQGEDMSSAIKRSPLIDPAIKQMVATGERTGSLAAVMNAAADHLDNQSAKQLKRLSALFEPIVIVGMGVVIGFIAVSVLLPLFRLTQAVRGG